MSRVHDDSATWAVVTPVFEDGASFARLCRDLSRLELGGGRLEIVAVDDGSSVDPPVAASIADAGLAGRILRLKRNVGHQMAICAGLHRVAAEPRFSGAVVMDCDGEDRPEDIRRLLEAAGDCDAVVALRRRRTERFFFRFFYGLYRWFFGLLTGRRIRFGNFCAINRRGLLRLAAMHETPLHLAAALIKSRLRRTEIPIDRGKRYAGRSRMNFSGLALHGIRAIAVFDDAVLTRLGLVCVGAASFSVVVLAIAVGLKLAGEATPGWLTVVTGFLVLVFLQTAALSLVALLMNGFGFRFPSEIGANVASLVLEVEAVGGGADA